MTTVPQFHKLLSKKASDVLFHRDDSLNTPCPCRTPEGYRDPIYHLQHPAAPLCNEAGFLPSNVIDMQVKAFVQPIQSTRATRLTSEYVLQMFGTIEADDHLGIFPYVWKGTVLSFWDWGQSGEDYVKYINRKFTVVNANLIPDPGDGSPFHHWEVGLRKITDIPITH